MARKAKTFRFDDETLADLVTLCDRWKVTQTEAIQRAIQEAIQSNTESNTEQYSDADPSEQWKELYKAERARVDDLTASNKELTDSLVTLSAKIADSLQASQVLQAADKEDLRPALPIIQDQTPGIQDPEPVKLTRWQHFKAIFKN